MIATREATIDDLYKIKEKAEIVCGEIKYFMATGEMNRATQATLFSSAHFEPICSRK